MHSRSCCTFQNLGLSGKLQTLLSMACLLLVVEDDNHIKEPWNWKLKMENYFQFPRKASVDIIFLSSDLNGERKQCKFICGDAEELHKKDDEWAEKLGVSRDPET